MSSGKPISIHYSNGQFFMWDIKDIKRIRNEYRIVGSFVGSPNWTGVIYQNKIHGLPLQLSNEECQFLLSECCDAKIYKQNLYDQGVLERCVKEHREFDEQFQDDYQPIHHQYCVEQIKQKLELIVKGKALKCQIPVEQIDRIQVLEDEIKKLKPINGDNQPRQLLISSPWSNTFSEVDMKVYIEGDSQLCCERPTFRDEHSLLRYCVYRDLNRKELYLTKGNKFGSDFLAYPTDPLFCHAQYLVVCLSSNQTLTKTLLHTYTRLGSQVNKNVLLVKFKTDQLVDFDNTNDAINHSPDLEYMVIKWQSNI